MTWRAVVAAVCLGALALSLLVWLTPAHAHAWTEREDGSIQFDQFDTLAAIEAVDPAYRAWVRRVIQCESRYYPYARGRFGERGVAQLHAVQLPHFYAAGYTDPDNPYEATEYLWRALRGDFASQSIGPWRWSCK